MSLSLLDTLESIEGGLVTCCIARRLSQPIYRDVRHRSNGLIIIADKILNLFVCGYILDDYEPGSSIGDHGHHCVAFFVADPNRSPPQKPRGVLPVSEKVQSAASL